MSNENSQGGAFLWFAFTRLPVTFTVLNNVFENNQSTLPPAKWRWEGGGAISFKGTGYTTAPYLTLVAEGNTAIGNTACDGIFDARELECFPF